MNIHSSSQLNKNFTVLLKYMHTSFWLKKKKKEKTLSYIDS